MIEKANLAHLLPELGRKLVCDIDARDVAKYQRCVLTAVLTAAPPVPEIIRTFPVPPGFGRKATLA
jgi:hypothetical protein